MYRITITTAVAALAVFGYTAEANYGTCPLTEEAVCAAGDSSHLQFSGDIYADNDSYYINPYIRETTASTYNNKYSDNDALYAYPLSLSYLTPAYITAEKR